MTAEQLGSSSDRDDVTARTFESFGYEWTTFSKIEPEDELFWHKYFRDVPLDELADEVALDAGCGKGRFAYFTAPHVRHLFACDGSDAVIAARSNLAGSPNVSLARADVRRMPLADHSVGFVYCLGVIHHLADPRSGFRELSRVLRPGGLLLLYVYSRSPRKDVRAFGLAAARTLRRLTTRVPHRSLRLLSMPLAALLYGMFVVPGWLGEKMGIAALRRLPLQTYRARPLRSLWLDTFDRLSAPVEHRYLFDEIAPWFEAEGLTVTTVRDDAGLFVTARKVEAS